MVLATFAFGEVVAGFFLRTQFFGGAIGMVVPAHVGLPVLASAAVAGDFAHVLSDGDPLWPARALNQRRRGSRSTDGRQRARSASRRVHHRWRVRGPCPARFMHTISASSKRNTSIRSCPSTLAVRADRRRTNRLGTADRHAGVHVVAGIHAHRRIVAICGIWRCHRAA